MAINCTPLRSSLAAHLDSAFTTVETETIILLLPEIHEVKVQVGDSMASDRNLGSSMSITTAAQEFSHIEVIMYVSKDSGNRHLVDRYNEELEVKMVDWVNEEVVVSDEEVYLEGACIKHRKVKACNSDKNLCFHDFVDAQSCVQSLFDPSTN